ncbi:MAG: Hpt domain-containing protein [Dokdonella sp.]
MRLQDNIDFTGLGWIKREVDTTLKQAQEALEGYVDNPADVGLMRFCANYLHTVQGALRMIELYGAAMVCEEMELLARGLLADQIKQREDAYGVLMRGIVQLPNYLERVQSGHKDIPIVLLPLLNDLRACRGEKLLSESVLFAPSLEAQLPPEAADATEPVAPVSTRTQTLRLRASYETALLKWFRNESDTRQLDRLIQILERLLGESSHHEARSLWWVASAVIETVRDAGLDASVALKLLFGRIDREIKRFAEAGEDSFCSKPPRELIQSLLYYVAHSKAQGARARDVREAYRLDTMLPTAGELQHAEGSMAGHNRDLLNTVSVAIKDDLLRVKEALDIFLRSRDADPTELLAQTDVLDRVGDTLGMLGLGVPRRLITEQRQVIEDLGSGRRPVDETTLLEIASTLLVVENSLDDHIERLGASGAPEQRPGDLELPRAEVRKILDALMREAAANVQQAKQDVVAFIEAPWDHSRVSPIPNLLDEIAGALSMLGLADGAEAMTGITRYIEIELLRDHVVPSAEQMDHLADALASIEYYLDATREQRAGRESILDVTRAGLAALGYWPVPPPLPRDELLHVDSSGIGAVDIPFHTEPDVQDDPLTHFASGHDSYIDHTLTSAIDIGDGDSLADLVVGEALPQVPAAHEIAGLRLAETEDFEADATADFDSTTFVESGFQPVDASEVDDDIREIFIEEVEDEIGNLRRELPIWSANLGDMESLAAIRRSFHTLKGSGRLVGALALGEFGWKIENMINRVLDATIAPSADVQDVVVQAVATLPSLLADLRGESSVGTDTRALTAQADRLASNVEVVEPTPFVDETRLAHALQPDDVDSDAEQSAIAKAAAFDPFEDEAADESISIDSTPLDRTALDESIYLDLATDDEIASAPRNEASGAQPHIDATLLEVLGAEVDTHVATIRDYLAACEPDAIPVTEALQRAVHTLNGTMATVDIPLLSAVLGPLETYVKRLDAAALTPDIAGLIALHSTADLTAKVIGRLRNGEPIPASSQVLAASLIELRDALPEVVRSSYADELAAIVDADSADESRVAFEATEQAEAVPEPPEPESAVPEWIEPEWVEPDRIGSVRIDPDGIEQAGIDQVGIDQVGIEPEFVAAAPADVVLDEADAPITTDPTESARNVATTAAALVEEIPPIPEDPQPDGRLELPDIDDDLLEVFLQEANDLLDHSDAEMAKLRDSPESVDLVASLQRDLHTLKGGARMAGLAPVGDLGHAMESLLEAIHSGRRRMDRLAIDSLERGYDCLLGLIRRIGAQQAIAMPNHAIARFEQLVAGQSIGRPIEVVGKSERAPREMEAASPAAKTGVHIVRVEETPRLPPLAADIEEEPARAPQEMIRVRSDLLDSLVNYAGEVSIYRSRLDQQVSSFRFNLVELEQTVSRLREQLRKFEIETETQIIARFQRDPEQLSDPTFDPLELDRFSQLQQYSRALGESVGDLVSIQGLLEELTRQSESLLLQQSRVSSDLQEGLMRTRMVPFDSLVPTLRRTLRQTAQELGKRAQLKVEGAQGEMDRNLLERMKAPFEHMLRNALTHGIESPEERVRVGKSPEGIVLVAVSREATEVVLRVSDDGRGLDRDAIRRRAIERKLLLPDAELPDADLYGFILESGFSTSTQVTQLAGRGVGMDVVHNEIKLLGGTLNIASEVGRGTVFTVRLPFTLAVTQAILVKLGEATYAVPMTAVQGVSRITREDHQQRISAGNATYGYAGEEFDLYELSQLLGVPATRVIEESLPLLMTRTGEQRAAIRVDAVLGSREVVVKSVGPQISSIPGIFGATILGDGSVVVILDLAPLVRRAAALRVNMAPAAVAESMQLLDVAPDAAENRLPLIMVVDDSITMRKVTTRVLERDDMEVMTAKDGVDAVEKLQDRVPDLMLLDIEMPRMDGYEVAVYMKNDPRLRRVPIIMITSRTGDKHRQRALEIGVERYLGKPYQEVDLLRHVHEVLDAQRTE